LQDEWGSFVGIFSLLPSFTTGVYFGSIPGLLVGLFFSLVNILYFRSINDPAVNEMSFIVAQFLVVAISFVVGLVRDKVNILKHELDEAEVEVQETEARVLNCKNNIDKLNKEIENLQGRIKEEEEMNKLLIGREKKMKELKEKLNKYKTDL
jgi:Na+/proline symporter